MKLLLVILLFIGCCLLLTNCDTVEPDIEGRGNTWIGCVDKDTVKIDKETAFKPILHYKNITFIGIYDDEGYMIGESGYYSFEFWYTISETMQGRFVLYHYGDVIIDTHLILERQWH